MNTEILMILWSLQIVLCNLHENRFKFKKPTYWWRVKYGQAIYTSRIYSRNRTSNTICIFPPIKSNNEDTWSNKNWWNLYQSGSVQSSSWPPGLSSNLAVTEYLFLTFSSACFPFPFLYCIHNFITIHPSPASKVAAPAYLRFTHWIKI